jgi:hypothetical protein
VGDIVSYADDLRGGAVITQRVVAVSEAEGTYTFTLTGSTAAATDEWSVAEDARLGRVALRIPGLAARVHTATAVVLSLPFLAGATVLAVALGVRGRRRAGGPRN